MSALSQRLNATKDEMVKNVRRGKAEIRQNVLQLVPLIMEK